MRALCVDAVQLRVEQGALGNQHIEQAGNPVVVAQLCQAQRGLQGVDAQLFGLGDFARRALRDQRVERVLECVLDRGLILRQHLLLARLGPLHLRAGTTGVEQRLRRRAGELPDPRLGVEQGGQARAFAAEKGAQRYRRKIRGPGQADTRIGGNQALFGLAQIRATFQQSRRQSRRHGGRRGQRFDGGTTLKRLFDQRSRAASDQDAERGFLRRELPGNPRQESSCLCGFRFRLTQFQFRCDPGLEAHAQKRCGGEARGNGAVGDRQLRIQRAQIEVVPGDICNKRKPDRFAIELRSQHLRPGRFTGAAEFPPEIDFVTGVERGTMIRVLRLDAGRGQCTLLTHAIARRAGTGGDARILVGAHDAEHGTCFIHAGDCAAQVEIVQQCVVDQAFEYGVVVGFPPGCGNRFILARTRPLHGSFNGGALVIGPEAHAGAQRQRCKRRCAESQTHHARSPCGGAWWGFSVACAASVL